MVVMIMTRNTFQILHVLAAALSALLFILLCAANCARPKAREFKRIRLATDTYLIIYQKVEEGLHGTSVQTSLAIKWPNSPHAEHITESCSLYDTTTEVRFLRVQSRYILVYGESLYYR